MSLLRTGPFEGPAPLPPTRSGGFGGVLRSLAGYSDAPGVRFTGWRKRQARVRLLNAFSQGVFSLWNENNYRWVRILMPRRESFQVNIKTYNEKANYYWVITICLGKWLLSSSLTLSLRSLATLTSNSTHAWLELP